MASTSTSSIQKNFKYDVFISFRGEDTRKTFVDHLYHALQHKSIITYKDDEKITKGNRISDELIGSIEDSRFYIIVFSKDYASSSWCLDELVKIMECQKTSDQRAYPVFYDVEPTQVRNQSGLVGKAFSKHEEDEAAGKWRKALKEAADLAGWELKNTFDGHEAKFIQKIVQEISLELRFIDSSVDEKLIGMENRVKGVVSTLETGSDDVRMIGIKGIGGGGKTTLARAIFDHISSWFEGKSFVENVREVSKASLSGLKKLQKQILSDVLNDQEIKISSVHDGKHMMQRMMCGRKVLVVLDDVDNVEQLRVLAGGPNWFKAGSRIIITTRDEQVLVAHGVKLIHNVNLLSNEEAICLFSRYAFGKEIPIQGYEELSGNVVRYAAGLPLTITVLGSFLCGKTDLEWIDALKRLKTIPLKDTLEKLELSYIGLEKDYKEIFLDVACILKGWEKEKAVEALESCGFHARNGLKVLEQRSLITISEDGSYLQVHDHIVEMGTNIVQRDHPNEPRMHSRLRILGEIQDILTHDSGNYDAIQCIQWNLISDETDMRGLGNMKKLRILDINWIFTVHDHIYAEEGLASSLLCFPNALRYLKWDFYPSRSLMKSFQADNLVGLFMPFSRITQFWKSGERKVLHKLRFVDMRYSHLRTFELEMTPNIEKLNLAGCHGLVELKMPLGCSKLKALYLECSGLRTLNLAPTPNLETLDLRECIKLAELTMPYQYPKPKFLRANYSSKLKSLGLLISNLLYCHDLVEFHMPNDCPMLKVSSLWAPNLENLDLYGCHGLVELHMACQYPNLRSLYLYSLKVRTLDLSLTWDLNILSCKECHDLEELHMPTGCGNLESLILENSNMRKFNLGQTPDLKKTSIEGCHEFHFRYQCPKLKSFSLNCPKLRTLDSRMSSDLETLTLEECSEVVELYMLNNCPKLKYLNLKNSSLRELNLELTLDLELLSLKECHDLEELHMPNRYPNLKSLILVNSNLRKINLGWTSDLEMLRLEGCHELSEFYLPCQCPKLKSFSLKYCSKLRSLDFRMSSDLETLSIEECLELVELHMPNECPKLKCLNLKNSALRNLNLGSTPDLWMLSLEGCHDLVGLHMPFRCPKLQVLSLECSKLRTLYHVYTPDLETLSLEGCFQLLELHMPNKCPNLKSLSLNNSQFRSLNLEPTPNLEWSNIKESFNLVELRAPIGCLEKLVYSDLSGYKGFKYFSFYNQIQSRVGSLHVIAESIDTCPMHSDSNLRFSYLYEEPISTSVGNLGKFISIGLSSFTKLESFSSGICDLQSLRKLTFEGSIPEVPKDLDRLQSLEKLSLISTAIKHLPDSICMLKHLKLLELNSCWFIEKLPEGLGLLECLEDLKLTSCINLQDIPKSICDMKRLKCLNLSSCLQVKKLPRELRRLECLKELNIKDTGISDLPDGIFELEGLHIVASDGFSCMVEPPQYKKQKTWHSV